MFVYQKPQANRNFQSLSRIYPRPSPYIQSNLHKFGTGPSSTMLPLQNEIPVSSRKLNLNCNHYNRKSNASGIVCYCCLEQIDQDFIDHMDKYFNPPNQDDQEKQSKSSIVQENQKTDNSQKPNESQSSLLKYFGNKTQQMKVAETQMQDDTPKNPVCCDCLKMICFECSRMCGKCHRMVCKFDFKEDNSLGLHNCN